MERLDYPPVWLAGFVALAALIARLVPGPELGMAGSLAGAVLLVLGILLVVLAAMRFRRAATTIVPHREPDALITTGIYRYSRNPIYLADLLILSGLALLFDAPVALVLVPVFGYVLVRRFIAPEEARLRAAFGTAFDDYARRTRRWL